MLHKQKILFIVHHLTTLYYFRAKFESKKGQEDLGKVSQIVERIRVQLEDQDKTIQQMHSNIATTKLSQNIEEVS